MLLLFVLLQIFYKTFIEVRLCKIIIITALYGYESRVIRVFIDFEKASTAAPLFIKT